MFHLAQHNHPLDFMILIDVVSIVLSNEDGEYWEVVQRAISIMIETSEIISANEADIMASGEETEDAKKTKEKTTSHVISEDQISSKNLANLAIFDYLAEKLSKLCYDRCWYAKKAR